MLTLLVREINIEQYFCCSVQQINQSKIEIDSPIHQVTVLDPISSPRPDPTTQGCTRRSSNILVACTEYSNSCFSTAYNTEQAVQVLYSSVPNVKFDSNSDGISLSNACYVKWKAQMAGMVELPEQYFIQCFSQSLIIRVTL